MSKQKFEIGSIVEIKNGKLKGYTADVERYIPELNNYIVRPNDDYWEQKKDGSYIVTSGAGPYNECDLVGRKRRKKVKKK